MVCVIQPSSPPEPREAALDAIALAATLLFAHRPHAPTVLLTRVAVNETTAFLVILAMTLGLILPRLLFGHLLPAFE
jgi:hypothetical protein